MSPPRTLCASLLPAAILLVACSVAPGASSPATPGPEVTFALPTAPPEDLPTEPPPVTIPPGFVLPVPSPLTAGNAWTYAQQELFERTGSLCFTHMEADGGGDLRFDGMAAKLTGSVGLLEDGRSYVGPLKDALAALDLEATGIEADGVAYGIGLVTAERALLHLPMGTVWAPRLDRFELADGRTGWALSGPWIAVIGDCGVLPTTPG